MTKYRQIAEALSWRSKKFRRQLNQFFGFPWIDSALSGLGHCDHHLRTVGATGALGGPQTKLRELEKFSGRPRRFSTIFITSGSPPPLASLIWAKAMGIKILLNQNGVYYPGALATYKRENLKIKKVHDLSDFVIYQTQFCLDSYAKWVGDLKPESQILFNAVDTNRFCPARLSSDEILKILITGHIDSYTSYQFKTLEPLLRLLRKQPHKTFKEIQVTFAGSCDAPLSSHFKNLESEFAANKGTILFKFRGPFSSSEAPALYQAHSLFLHLKYKDPCPNAAIEAMACGLPVIFGNSGGTPEIVGEAGYGIELPDDWTEMYSLPASEVHEAIRKLDQDELQRLSLIARRRVEEKMNVETWAKKHIEIGNSLKSH